MSSFPLPASVPRFFFDDALIGHRHLWPEDRRMDSLKGRTIRIRFNIKDARLFTFEAKT